MYLYSVLPEAYTGTHYKVATYRRYMPPGHLRQNILDNGHIPPVN